jgi:hypothetical protein
MQVTVDIPDDVAERLKAAGGDLSRRALEALALEAYKRRQLTKPDLRRLLGFGTRDALDGSSRPMTCSSPTASTTSRASGMIWNGSGFDADATRRR